MSSFRDEFLKARMGKLPVQLPAELLNNDEDDEEEELDTFDEGSMAGTSSDASNFLKPKARGNAAASSTTTAGGRGGAPDFSPISGQGYFQTAMSVSVASSSAAPQIGSSATASSSSQHDTFRIYYTQPSATTSQGSGGVDYYDDNDEDEEPVVFVCHHGAGYSAMSFALLAKTLAESSGGKAGTLALDVRGHGECENAEPRLRSKKMLGGRRHDDG